MAVSQIGDPPYNYTSALLKKFGLGPETCSGSRSAPTPTAAPRRWRAGRADATLLTPPAYFKLEEAGFKCLGNLADHDDIFASTTYLMRKSTVAANPRLPELLIKAHAEAIKRFYDDKAFAVKAYQVVRQADDRRRRALLRRLRDRPTCWSACPTCSPAR